MVVFVTSVGVEVGAPVVGEMVDVDVVLVCGGVVGVVVFSSKPLIHIINNSKSIKYLS